MLTPQELSILQDSIDQMVHPSDIIQRRKCSMRIPRIIMLEQLFTEGASSVTGRYINLNDLDFTNTIK